MKDDPVLAKFEAYKQRTLLRFTIHITLSAMRGDLPNPQRNVKTFTYPLDRILLARMQQDVLNALP